VMRLWRVVVLGVGDGGSWCSGDELEVAAVVASGWWRWRRGGGGGSVCGGDGEACGGEWWRVTWGIG
ncbi:hypothetical protein Tco_0476946, partial [Tanacetum coccineum]